MSVVLKSSAEVAKMREAGRIVAQALEAITAEVRAGVTTKSLDIVAEKLIREAGATPSFKGYHGYPASVCVSVNEQVVHGIPGPRVLQEGDIVSLDLGCVFHGWHGDSAVTVAVGKVSADAQRLMDVTKKALELGIAQARVGNQIRDISKAIQDCAESHGYAVVRDYVGHAIGRQMHEPEPQVPNFVSPHMGDMLLREGMTLALEPMVNLGTYKVKVLADHWTVVTLDGKLSAHFEHTVAVGANGPAILSLP